MIKLNNIIRNKYYFILLKLYSKFKSRRNWEKEWNKLNQIVFKNSIAWFTFTLLEGFGYNKSRIKFIIYSLLFFIYYFNSFDLIIFFALNKINLI